MGPWCSVMDLGDWLLMIAFSVAALALVVWGVDRLFPASRQADAQGLLASRLASGEIDAESYRELRDTLSHPRSPARRAEQ